MNKGFTLIELLIVVAIVGIIGAVAIPALFGSGSNSDGTRHSQSN